MQTPSELAASSPHHHLSAAQQTPSSIIRKTSVKRCLSPESASQDAMNPGTKRKITDPGLLLVQSQYSADLSMLDTHYKLMVDKRSQDSSQDTTPTYDPGSPPSSALSVPSLPTLSSHCYSSQITPHSSSYTSWTKPIQVRYKSDEQ